MTRFIVRWLVKINPLHFIIAAACEMGWDVAVENRDQVEGLTMGTEEYIDRHILEEQWQTGYLLMRR